MRAFLGILLILVVFGGWASPTYAQDPLPPSKEDPLLEAETQPDAEDEILGTIDKITFTGINSVSGNLVADIATLKVGDSFTRKKLENSINDLRKWGIFSKVEVLVEYDGDKVTLNYDLEEGFVIKQIHIKGNYPLLESKVRQTLFLNPGIIYQHDKLAEQVDRLDQLYENEGYYGTTVLAIEDYDKENHQVTLYFRIKKGTTYRLRKTTVEGNTALNEGRIKSIVFTFFHFKPKQLKKDLQKITDIYKRKGFVRARVRVGSEYFDYDAKKIDLDLLIRQGPRIKLAFEGNDHFFTKTLKKNITVYEGGDFDEFELDASKKELTKFYQERGFEAVKVEWERIKLNKDYYLIIFKITEGEQRKVLEIKFNGNAHYSEGKLKDLIVTKENGLFSPGYFYQPLFEQDLHSITTFYHEEGYLKAKIVSWLKTYTPLGDMVSLTIDIEEGPRAQVKEMQLLGLPEDLTEGIQEKLVLQPNAFYSVERLNDDIQTILVDLANKGRPYTTVSHDAVEVAPDVYNVTYTVTEGKPVTIGKIIFVGNIKTKEKVIRQNMRIKEGDAFSTQKLLQSQLNLRRLGIFNVVAVETLGLTSLRDQVNVVVRVQEKKDKVLDFEIGYNTDLGISGKVVFNKLNFRGSGKNLNFKVQAGTQVNRAEANYIDPRVLGTGLQLTLGAYGGREDRPFFLNNSVGVYGSLFKQLNRTVYTWGRLDFSFNDVNTSNTVFNVINPTFVPNDQTRLTTTLGVTRDTRDNFGDPHRGTYLSGTAALTNQFFTLDGNYSTVRANMGHWYSPFSRVTIANALRVANIFKVPSSTLVPADSRLYLGGDNTVRGFQQDALLPSGGTFSLVHNLELIVRAFNKFQVVAFLDSGVVTNGITEVNLTTLRHSAGPGIRYVTPVGPIRVDWGFILDPEPTDSTSNRVHFSFGYFF